MDKDFFKNRAKEFESRKFRFLVPMTDDLIKKAHEIEAAFEAKKRTAEQKILITDSDESARLILGWSMLNKLKKLRSSNTHSGSLFTIMDILRLFLRYREEISRVIKRYKAENDFGQSDDKLVIKKLNEFIIANVPRLAGYTHLSGKYNSLPEDYTKYMILLNERFLFSQQNQASDSIRKKKNNGLDFEKECYALLAGGGYNITETAKTGDFGADLIASKDGLKFAIQCKDFQKPVGVEAVQQAHSAKEYFTADFAVVVCSSKYTPAAIKMASKLNVMCISKNKLPKINEICGDFID